MRDHCSDNSQDERIIALTNFVSMDQHMEYSGNKTFTAYTAAGDDLVFVPQYHSAGSTKIAPNATD